MSQRLWVLEGVGGSGKGLDRVRSAVGRDRTNGPEYTVLSHSGVRFHQRLYTPFGPFPRTLRPREPLADILSSPSTYDRQAISGSLSATLARLRDLSLAPTLVSAKQLGLFPTSSGLLELEAKFGGPIALTDVYGRDHPAAHTHEMNVQRLAAAQVRAIKREYHSEGAVQT